jgi:hypothetical protein
MEAFDKRDVKCVILARSSTGREIQHRKETVFGMRWVRFAAIAFVLHLAWEMGQMPLYRGMQGRPWWSTVVPCARAALFDVAVTLALGILFVAVARPRSSSVTAGVAMVAAGAAIAILVEKTGVGRGRWAYTGDMPKLPPLGLGLMPMLQMMLIPAVSAWLALRPLRAGQQPHASP